MKCLIICMKLTSLINEVEHHELVNQLASLILPLPHLLQSSWHDDDDGGAFFPCCGDAYGGLMRMISCPELAGL